jgi:hypothetical protein
MWINVALLAVLPLVKIAAHKYWDQTPTPMLLRPKKRVVFQMKIITIVLLAPFPLPCALTSTGNSGKVTGLTYAAQAKRNGPHPLAITHTVTIPQSSVTASGFKTLYRMCRATSSALPPLVYYTLWYVKYFISNSKTPKTSANPLTRS